MGKNKITLSDIAKEANVSLATVSYALNHSDKEKISHETRLKVFAAAKKLNYYPNVGYRFSKEKSNNLIGIVLDLKNSPRSKVYHNYDIVTELTKNLSLLGYHTVLIPSEELDSKVDILSKKLLDGVFILDADYNKYKNITIHTYAPIIFLECDIEDGLFYKILPDFKKAFERACGILKEAQPFILAEYYSNQLILQDVLGCVPPEKILLHKKDADIPGFLHRQKGCGIVFGELLGLQAASFYDPEKLLVVRFEDETFLPEKIRTLSFSTAALAKKSADIMMSLIHFSEEDSARKSIYIEPI